ncbi:MAG: hypothetical protein PHC64_01460 [Candidatus Gastranaerophilales bacterium]|nr:hypothetical protein [Candidatus Gastranaerophilales bacterium]
MINATEVKMENSKVNRVSNPIYHSRFQNLEKALTELFIKELNAPDSIFIKISPDVVKKTAMFLAGMAFRPVAIGVCGETASGKSTIVCDVIDTIQKFVQKASAENIVTRINTDDYYYDRSEEIKQAGSFDEFAKNYDFDVPEAIELSLAKAHIQMLLDNKEVFLPKYDLSGTGRRFDNHRAAKSSSIIVCEGLYTLIDGFDDVFDFKIYVDIDKDVQKKRFFERVEQRGLGASADKIFENASQKALIYVHPCAQKADIALNGETPREKYRSFVNSLLELVENTYYFAV